MSGVSGVNSYDSSLYQQLLQTLSQSGGTSGSQGSSSSDLLSLLGSGTSHRHRTARAPVASRANSRRPSPRPSKTPGTRPLRPTWRRPSAARSTRP